MNRRRVFLNAAWVVFFGIAVPFLLQGDPAFAKAGLAPNIDFGANQQNVLVYGAEGSDTVGSSDYYFRGIVTADVNGDGVADMIMGSSYADGAGNLKPSCGEVYIYYGKTSGLAGTKDVAGTSGAAPDVIIYGENAGDRLSAYGGLSAADINGDGVADLIIGAPYANGPGGNRAGSGEVYVIFGSKTLPASIDLGAGGANVVIYGADAGDALGFNGAIAFGDVNGDGKNDIILGSPSASGPANGRLACGEGYIIYGSATLPASIDLDTTQPGSHQDVTIYGADAGDALTMFNGIMTTDVNSDGTVDIVLSALGGDGPANGRADCGEAYVIYGGAGLASTIDLDTTQQGAHQDVTIYGAGSNDSIGYLGGLATGDVNGDGARDIVLESSQADGPGDTRPASGEIYVIYGGAGLASTIDLDTTQPGAHQDLTVYGGASNDNLGVYKDFLTADVNGDGIDDLVMGSPYATYTAEGRGQCGRVYVIYGGSLLGGAKDLGLGDFDVAVWGRASWDYLTMYSALTAGDVNGDGLADIIIGAPFADGPLNARSDAGEAYIIYGSAALSSLYDLETTSPLAHQNVTICGATTNDNLSYNGGFATGDVNGDGVTDLLIDAPYADGPADGRGSCGEVYAVFGAGFFSSATVKRTDNAGKSVGKDYDTARAFIQFSSGASASTTTVTVTRNDTGVNLPDLAVVANVNWTITSTRAGFSGDVTLHYLDSEITGLVENNLNVYRADTIGGAYSLVTNAVWNRDLNIVTIPGVTGSSVFVLRDDGPPVNLNCFVSTAASESGYGSNLLGRVKSFFARLLSLAGLA